MHPVLYMIGGVMTGLAIGRREILWLGIGVLAIVAASVLSDGSNAWPAFAVAALAGFILARALPKRRRRRGSYGTSGSDAYMSSSWSDSSASSSSSSDGGSWFGGGESGGGGASADWGGDSGGDSGGGDSGGGDSGGGDSGGSSD